MQQWFLKTVVQDAFGRQIPFKTFEHLDDDKMQSLDDSTKERLYHSKNKLTDSSDSEWGACQVDYLTEYLNREDVQNALHAKIGTDWSLCSNATNYNGSDISNEMEPYYKFLIDGGYDLDITIYSGDDDSVCGTLGTQSWIYDLGYDISKSWTAWTDTDGQTGGYYVKFSDPKNSDKTAFTFVTVHSAGHQVPWYKPSRGYQMFTSYLNGDF